MRRVLVAAAIVAAAAAASAGRADAPLPVRVDGACLHACPGDRSPVWSPDGKRIAFLRYRTGARGERRQAVFVIQPHGAGAKLVYDPARPETLAGLAWSPDSSSLAVIAGGSLRIIPLTGGPPFALADTSGAFGPYGGPAWSPDGTRLAFVRVKTTGVRQPSLCCELWVATADGTASSRVAGSFTSAWAAHPLWRPDGRLTFVTGPRTAVGTEILQPGEIHTANADGSGERTLGTTSGLGAVSLVGWSPSGQRPYLAGATPPQFETISLNALATDGSTLTIAHWPASGITCCALSPDATRAVLLRLRAGGTQLLEVELGTRGERVLTAGVGGQGRVADNSASWSPDGSQVAYLGDGECATLIAVYVVNSNGSRARRITLPCRRVGTPRRDVLEGTVGADAIYGRGGADKLDGRFGPDYVDGGDGNDVVAGYFGDDRLIGGRGRDRLVGGTGWDRIYARDGTPDVISCGPGRDGVIADRNDRVARDCEVVDRP